MRLIEEYKTTVNRTVYNRTRKMILEHEAKIRCSYCPYHKKENQTTKWYGGFEEIEVRQPNWKLISKHKKQWMGRRIKIKRTRSYFEFDF